MNEKLSSFDTPSTPGFDKKRFTLTFILAEMLHFVSRDPLNYSTLRIGADFLEQLANKTLKYVGVR
jgi:hypothetical protein